VHLGRLVELEYVVAHRGPGHSQRFGYELLYASSSAEGPFLSGLINADELGNVYDGNRSGLSGNRSGQNEDRSGGGRPLVGPRSVGSRGDETSEREPKRSANPENGTSSVEKPRRGTGEARRVVPLAAVAALAAVRAS
jgi:hypothetical protein